jgi:hypothetical protein
MQISVKVDASGVFRMLDSHLRQVPFTVAKALTATAKDAQAAVTASIPVKFDRPNPFTQKAVTIIPAATKSNAVATVLVKDAQAKYLEIQEDGGQRKPEPGSPINLPVKYRLNQYGNIARGAISREKARPDTFVSTGRGKTKHLAPGLYRRPGGRGNKKGTAPQMLIAFKKRAQYAPRFGMRDTVEGAVKTAFQTRLAEAVELAIRTAR